MNSHPNRIPGQDVKDCRTWKIPEIDGGKVVPSAEREARDRREREARMRGEVIGEDFASDKVGGPITAVELERITEEAHRDGYAAGFEQGHAEGLKTGSAEGEKTAYAETRERLESNLESLTQLIDGISDPYETQTQQLQELLLETLMSLTGSVIKRELALQPLEIHKVVEMAISALPKLSTNVTIQLHPDDIAMLQDTQPNKAAQWQLQENSELSRGGVKVLSKDSLVDFSIERQLALIEEKLLRGELAEASSEVGNNSKPHDGHSEPE